MFKTLMNYSVTKRERIVGGWEVGSVPVKKCRQANRQNIESNIDKCQNTRGVTDVKCRI